MNESLDRKVFPEYLPSNARKTLANFGVGILADMAHFKKSEIRALPGIGPKAMSLIKEEMIEKGLSFRSEYK